MPTPTGISASFPPQFIPRRDDRFESTRPVDGSDTATDWRGVHGVESSPHLVDPPNGWIQNTNNWPYSAAGRDSPPRHRYPKYMDVVGEIPRGQEAIRVLVGRRDWTIERLRAAAFDPYLTAFARLVPRLVTGVRLAGHGPGRGRPGRADRRAPRLGLSLVRGERADLPRRRRGCTSC